MARRISPALDIIAKGALSAGVVMAVLVNSGLLERRADAHSPVAAPTMVAPQPRATPSPVAPPAPAASPTAIAAPLVVKRILDVPSPFEHGDWKWDDAGVPDGPIVITVDRAAQTLSVFRGGYEIGTAVVLYGADQKPTPLGTFPITQKDATHFSNLYGGAPMPYMLRLTNDGVSIHGSKVAYGYATHGCIGVPIAFAKKLFAAVKLGDPVIVTDGKRLGMGQAIAQS